MNWRASQDAAAPGGYLPRTPPRRARSVRRTTTMQMRWPDGLEGPVALIGRGRDILTPEPGAAPVLLAIDELEARALRDGTLAALATTPDRPELAALTGQPALRGYRGRLAELMTGRADRERPLGTLLDDIAPASLISGWALTLWPDSPFYGFRPGPSRRKVMEGVCIGHAPDSSAFAQEQDRSEADIAPTITDADDAEGWHAPAPEARVEMRRSRRIDLWRKDGLVHIDAMFQDSATAPDGTRRAIHEYALRATVDPAAWTIASVVAEPRILPYPECPGAAANIGRLIGTPAGDLRPRVLDELRGTAGCTHLNDALRALAAIPWLGAALDAPIREEIR